MKNLSIEQQEYWRKIDPEFWADLDTLLQPYEAPVRIERAFAQRLTTWSDELDKKGRGQFQFSVGDKNARQKITLNFAWGNVGPGGTYALNRWFEELQYLLRKEEGIKIYKSSAYLPNTQDHQLWCQFIEVRKFGMPIQAYCIWNGNTIIQSVAHPIVRDNAYDWSFDWRNAKALDKMLELVKDLG
jgi:hypothetical protein